MGLFERKVAALVAAGLLIGATPSLAAVPKTHVNAKAPQAKLPAVADSIAIAVNGDELPPDPAPRIVGKGGGRLVVPVIRIYSALGIGVSRSGNAITASAPGKQIVLHIGSSQALIDGRAVTMESPAITIDGATYVPLRFVAESLGAQATFNAKASRVEIVSSLVGRNPAFEQRAAGGMSQIVGTVSAIDLNSQPQSVTVQRGPSVRTVSITSDARVLLQDVVARTSTPGMLSDVHVGDAVSVFVLRDGHIDSVIVRYASRNGTIAAVSSSQFVLNTGFILSPDRSTTIALNSEPATFADLRVGDSVVVRLNPDTNEKRQIIVSRAVAPVPASTGAVAIASFTTSGKAALRAGDAFAVSLIGTPGGKASFDIGTYVVGLPLIESQPGTYAGRYTVPANVNFGQTAIYGHLNVGGTDAPRATAPALIAVSNTPPQIVDIAPSNGQTVNNNRPSIYATFRAPAGVDINASTVTINVNGQDVTPSSTRTDQFITYSPANALNDGQVNIEVRVADAAGNTQTRTWSFTVRAR